MTAPAPVGADACDGLCVWAADLGVPGAGVAYPHPGCPLHAPDEECGCGQPDRCLSPTHGQITMAEALEIRHAQDPTSGSNFLTLGEALEMRRDLNVLWYPPTYADDEPPW